MLEISHLTKIYKNKVGKDVKALDDVSLKFPETGMVFLLGKSGSGKSTLLNVCGGLDSPTNGEILIKGKSSKNFSQSDFDSYRNTYVGFVFQEYNILNEFSVYDNIALALELQNKNVEHDFIIKLLDMVDLNGFENRKPNTLSGGQKQRIAIARALVKNPEIIMADEPTGALDSNTGKQVLDTLKRLSKERLVIVVSHDREFAEEYADRIIELKDGKVLNDITKVNKIGEVISDNISQVGNTLCIKEGSKITKDDFHKIVSFLSGSKNVILTKDQNNIKSFKKLVKINDSLEQEVFENTNEENIEFKEYDQKKNIFIKSKLPIKHALRIGLSSLKNKPLRLAFTILLCSVSFLLFGLLSTMTFYDNENTFKDTLKNSEFDFIRLNKQYQMNEISYYGDEEFNYTNYGLTPFYRSDYEFLKNKYGSDTFYGFETFTNFSTAKSPNKYYLNYIYYFSYMDNENNLYKNITGSYPKNDNEILLSSYLVDSMIDLNVYGSDNKTLNLVERKDILNKEIILNNNKYKVVGYFDSGSIDSKYEELKNGDASSILDGDYLNYLRDGLHLMVFMSENELKEMSSNMVSDYYHPSITDYTTIVLKDKDSEELFDEYPNASYLNYDDEMNVIGSGELFDNQGIVNINLFAMLVNHRYTDNIEIIELSANLINNGYYKDEEFIKYTHEERVDVVSKLYDLVKDDKLILEYKMFSYTNDISFGEVYDIEVVGVSTDNYPVDLIIINEDVFNKRWEEHKKQTDYYSISTTKYNIENTPYHIVYVPFDKSSDMINNFWDIYSNELYEEDDSKYILSGSYIDTLVMIDEFVDILSSVFLYSGIFLCIFALLLFSNFISISISNKTKEIGILRAIGARSVDVFKIFFSESIFIAVICLVLSIIFSIVICNLLNNLLAYSIGVSVFVFGILSLMVMVLLGLITTFIATYIPVRKAAKRKPVESIRAL